MDRRTFKIINLLIVCITLIIFWGVLFWFYSQYGKELQTDPCSICAERMGDNVICRMENAQRTYYNNGSILDIYFLTGRGQKVLDSIQVDFSKYKSNISKNGSS